MTEYEAGLPVQVAFPPEEVPSLAEAVSRAGWRQLHVAETEKYAHVTYFFNGGREAPWPGEDRLLVPSPKVATYDLQPEMSAVGRDRRAGRGDRCRTSTTSSSPTTPTRTWSATPVSGTRRSGPWPRSTPAWPGRDRGRGRRSRRSDCDRRRPPRHGRPRQRRRAARRVRRAGHGPLAEPGPDRRVGRSVVGRRLRDGVLADVTPTILELAGLPSWPAVAGRSLLEPVLPSDGPSSPRSDRP